MSLSLPYQAHSDSLSGETGFNSLTKAFNRAISGLNDNSQASYAQVFLGKHSRLEQN